MTKLHLVKEEPVAFCCNQALVVDHMSKVNILMIGLWRIECLALYCVPHIENHHGVYGMRNIPGLVVLVFANLQAHQMLFKGICAQSEPFVC